MWLKVYADGFMNFYSGLEEFLEFRFSWNSIVFPSNQPKFTLPNNHWIAPKIHNNQSQISTFSLGWLLEPKNKIAGVISYIVFKSKLCQCHVSPSTCKITHNPFLKSPPFFFLHIIQRLNPNVVFTVMKTII